MPKKDAPETSEEIKAQIEEASKDLTFEDIESEETKEAKEGEEETQTEEQETSTEETETPDKEETEEESQPKLYQIKVDGKTEYVTEEKLVEYAQKGRFLERERAKDKTQTKGDEANWEIIDKQIIDKIKTQGFAKTMAE
ncbi:MAG: hypothetical protein GTO24_16305, partial [candidate division Zixibacteria bacterium]|nr:hypothetical protein [candidate division Zixibacteria bacterium]